jgi:hypothetical protein
MIGQGGVPENVSVRLLPRAAVSQFHNELLVLLGLLGLLAPFRGGPSWRRPCCALVRGCRCRRRCRRGRTNMQQRAGERTNERTDGRTSGRPDESERLDWTGVDWTGWRPSRTFPRHCQAALTVPLVAGAAGGLLRQRLGGRNRRCIRSTRPTAGQLDRQSCGTRGGG